MTRKGYFAERVWVWGLAARPKTLAASAVPVLVGTAMAYRIGEFKPLAALITLVFALFAQIAANFVNDWADGRRGEDDLSKRLGPTRMVAAGRITPRAMLVGTFVALGIACSAGVSLLVFGYGGVHLILIGAVCALFALLYSAGPFPLAHYGMGDLLVVLFFGLVATTGTFYVQSRTFDWKILCAALAVGFATDTILVANNYRDVNEDRRNRKFTLIVLLGERFGRFLYLFDGLIAAGLFAFLCLVDAPNFWNGVALLLPVFWLTDHGHAWRNLTRIHSEKCGGNLRLVADSVLAASAKNLFKLGFFMTCWAIFCK